MKNKKIWITVIFSVVAAALILTVLIIGYQKKISAPVDDVSMETVRTFDTLEEAVEWAGFSMRCSDRLNGVLSTDYEADKSAITVNYGNAGYICKTLIAQEMETDVTAVPAEEMKNIYEIDGMTVRFTGDETAVSKAEWTDNGFNYVINLTGSGINAETMTDYIRATR